MWLKESSIHNHSVIQWPWKYLKNTLPFWSTFLFCITKCSSCLYTHKYSINILYLFLSRQAMYNNVDEYNTHLKGKICSCTTCLIYQLFIPNTALHHSLLNKIYLYKPHQQDLYIRSAVHHKFTWECAVMKSLEGLNRK